MGRTRIEWAEAVWNPVTGCSPVSEGCEHCYARRLAHRMRGRFGYPEDDPFRVTLHPERLEEPLRWRKPRRVFVCSMGDLFHPDVPMDFIAEVFNIMACTTLECRKRHEHEDEECWSGEPHTFLVLTKRPQRMKQVIEELPNSLGEDWPGDAPLCVALEVGEWPLRNVWVGVTVENQTRADERIPILLEIPAAVRWVSCEPLLGPIALRPYDDFSDSGHGRRWLGGPSCNAARSPGIDWVVCGAETGPGARPCDPEWVRSLRDQCQEAGVPFFFKRWSDGSRLLDGREWNEVPVRTR